MSLLTVVLDWPTGKLPPPPLAKEGVWKDPVEKTSGFDPSTFLFDLRCGLPTEELEPVEEEEVVLEETTEPDESLLLKGADEAPPEDLPPTLALRVYRLFEEPNSTRGAEILSVVTTIFILVSVLTLV